MAKEIGLSDIEPEIELFRQINIKTVQLVLDRAERRALSASRSQHHAAQAASEPSKLQKVLEKAMAFHGRSARNKPSIRLKAPDTAGRPYHFGYTVVTKGMRKQTTSSARRAGQVVRAPGQGTASPSAKEAPKPRGTGRSSRHKANTREGAHQVYTERDAAVEQGQALDNPSMAYATGLGQGAMAAPNAIAREMDGQGPQEEQPDKAERHRLSAGPERPSPQAWVEEGISLTPGLSERYGEAAAQRYIEDEGKLPKLRGHTASFGTIGDTLDERLRFWDLVHEHESDKGGRTQHRLVLELPHEASAAERHEIVRRYADEMFRSKGLPCWASIHAPTKENDSRNHHAHVVFSDRPAKLMTDPATGKEEWDFAVAELHRKKSRNTVTRYPHRQNRDAATRDRGWVKDARSRFADVTNDVMSRAGKGALYDPRSYKDMGLEASPMRNVTRIIADKTKSRSFVVMDAEWTRKMIDEEVKDAAMRRDATFQALVRTETLLQESGRSAAQVAKVNARLPRHLRLGPSAILGTEIARRITTKVLENERERLSQRFVSQATERALRHVIEATSPAPRGKKGAKVHDPSQAPDPADLAELHQAATEELMIHRRESLATFGRLDLRLRELRRQWSPSAPQGGTGGGIALPGRSPPAPAGQATQRPGDGRPSGAFKTPAAPPPPQKARPGSFQPLAPPPEEAQPVRRPPMGWPVGTLDRVAAKLKATLPVLEHPDDAPRVFADLLAKMSAEHAALRKAYQEGTWNAGAESARRPASEAGQAARAPEPQRPGPQDLPRPAQRPVSPEQAEAAPPSMTEAFIELAVPARTSPKLEGAARTQVLPDSARPQERPLTLAGGALRPPEKAKVTPQPWQPTAAAGHRSGLASLFLEASRTPPAGGEPTDAAFPNRSPPFARQDTPEEGALTEKEEKALAKRRARRRAILRSLKRGGLER